MQNIDTPKSFSVFNSELKKLVLIDQVYLSNQNTFGPPRSADTYFLFFHSALPCYENLEHWYNRKKFENNVCPLCSYRAPETSIHLFLCVTWIPLWHFVIQTLSPLINYTSISELFLPTKQHKHKRFVNTFVFATMNKIWKARNEKIFEGKDPDVPKILETIRSRTPLIKYFCPTVTHILCLGF